MLNIYTSIGTFSFKIPAKLYRMWIIRLKWHKNETKISWNKACTQLAQTLLTLHCHCKHNCTKSPLHTKFTLPSQNAKKTQLSTVQYSLFPAHSSILIVGSGWHNGIVLASGASYLCSMPGPGNQRRLWGSLHASDKERREWLIQPNFETHG